MIGKAAKVSRLAVIFAVGGSVGWTRASAAFTSSSVRYMSTFHEKNRSISAVPRLVMRPQVIQPLHGVHGLFDGPRDRHQHLVDGHHAVVHAHHDAREIRSPETPRPEW